MMDIDKHWMVRIDEQQDIKIRNKVDTRAYRQAMREQLDAERKR
jgi:hypothetical protein